MVKLKHIEGKEVGQIILYAISTCGWCRKVKNLLKDLGVEYYYLDVDLLEGEEKKEVLEEVERWNPKRNFPTLVINNEKCVVGFEEDEIREVLRRR